MGLFWKISCGNDVVIHLCKDVQVCMSLGEYATCSSTFPSHSVNFLISKDENKCMMKFPVQLGPGQEHAAGNS